MVASGGGTVPRTQGRREDLGDIRTGGSQGVLLELGAPLMVCDRQCLAGPTELETEPVVLTSAIAKVTQTASASKLSSSHLPVFL